MGIFFAYVNISNIFWLIRLFVSLWGMGRVCALGEGVKRRC